MYSFWAFQIYRFLRNHQSYRRLLFRRSYRRFNGDPPSLYTVHVFILVLYNTKRILHGISINSFTLNVSWPNYIYIVDQKMCHRHSGAHKLPNDYAIYGVLYITGKNITLHSLRAVMWDMFWYSDDWTKHVHMRLFIQLVWNFDTIPSVMMFLYKNWMYSTHLIVLRMALLRNVSMSQQCPISRSRHRDFVCV